MAIGEAIDVELRLKVLETGVRSRHSVDRMRSRQDADKTVIVRSYLKKAEAIKKVSDR